MGNTSSTTSSSLESFPTRDLHNNGHQNGTHDTNLYHQQQSNVTSSVVTIIKKRSTTRKEDRIRLWRILLVFIIFAVTSIYRLNQHTFLTKSFLAFIDVTTDNESSNYNNQTTTTNTEWLRPVTEREWDRMLFGIFTYDSSNEAELRLANRETHLNYFKHYYKAAISDVDSSIRHDTICSLQDLLNNITLSNDSNSCRIVYTFVMGGGIGDENMKRKVNTLDREKGAASKVKTRCLYQDDDCGGTDITRWTLDKPHCNITDVFKAELEKYNDITLLSVPENHELGKTDTWFTYTAMLTRQRPDLQIGFVGKIDSDNFIRWPVFLKWFSAHRSNIILQPFIYGGYAIHKKVCSGVAYGRACAKKEFIAELFAAGAMAYMSTPLAQHVFMDGTTLQRKKEVWIVGEDMQLANMAYSDPKITPFVLNHRYGEGGYEISVHCVNNPVNYRDWYYKLYPEQQQQKK